MVLKKFFKKTKKGHLVLLLIVANIFIPIALISSILYLSSQSNDFILNKRSVSKSTFVPHEVTEFTIQDLSTKLEVKKEGERIAEERKNNIQKVENIFERYDSPMKGYGDIIVRRAEECGGDFRVLIGIAGNESLFGRVPYKLYNPFGYLDGKQYSGWEESLEFLSCVISQRFLQPCQNDLRCIINRYGGPDTDKEHWIRSVQFFINNI